MQLELNHLHATVTHRRIEMQRSSVTVENTSVKLSSSPANRVFFLLPSGGEHPAGREMTLVPLVKSTRQGPDKHVSH